MSEQNTIEYHCLYCGAHGLLFFPADQLEGLICTHHCGSTAVAFNLPDEPIHIDGEPYGGLLPHQPLGTEPPS